MAAQVWRGDINLAAPSPRSLPPQFPPGPRPGPTAPRSGSQRSALLSQQDRALSPPPKLAPLLKNKGPSRQVGIALLRLRKQKELLAGTSQKAGGRSSPFCRNLTPPTAREPPHLSRLWVPPAPKFRCDPTTVPKQRSEREVKEQPGEGQTSSDSSSQVSLVHLR